jgi:hypothetical protein
MSYISTKMGSLNKTDKTLKLFFKKVKKFRNLFYILTISLMMLSLNNISCLKVFSDNKCTVNIECEKNPLVSTSDGQIWNKSWGMAGTDKGNSVWGDGTYYYTTGYTEIYGTGNFDLLIIKWDSNGNKIWNQTWDGSSADVGNSIWGDGTYIYTVGYTEQSSGNNKDLLVIKWNSAGIIIWNQSWDETLYDIGNSIWGDGNNLYITGYTTNYLGSIGDLLVIKLDTNGTQIWNKKWNNPDSNRGNCIWGDGTNLYITGYTGVSSSGYNNLIIIKSDYDGNMFWYKTWGGSLKDQGTSIWGDGTYLYTTGQTSSFGEGEHDLLIIKWDNKGKQIWNKTWGGLDEDKGNYIWGDGINLYTTGTSKALYAHNYYLTLIKWDFNGNVVWNRNWGDQNGDDAGNCIFGNSSVIYITGSSRSYDTFSSDLMIIKWDSSGSSQSTTITTVDGSSFTPDQENIVIFGLITVGIIVLIVIINKKFKKRSGNKNFDKKPKPDSSEKDPISMVNNQSVSKHTPPPNKLDQKQRIEQMKEKLKLQQDQKDQEILSKFQKIMEISKKIKRSQAADMLGISGDDLLNKLIEWGELFPFRIDDEMIIVDDIMAFTSALDNQFKEWSLKEQTKDGKIEQIHPKINSNLPVQEVFRENEQEMITKFSKIMKFSKKIKKSQVADMLGISIIEISALLNRWVNHFPIEIKGEMIVVNDMAAFITSLDVQFQNWKNNE